MAPISSNEEFFATLKTLVDGWCDRRALAPLSVILGPYLAFNGLTDGWGDLLKAIKWARVTGRGHLPEGELDTLHELERVAERVVYRDQV